jgi:hypothetical protein
MPAEDPPLRLGGSLLRIPPAPPAPIEVQLCQVLAAARDELIETITVAHHGKASTPYRCRRCETAADCALSVIMSKLVRYRDGSMQFVLET